MTTTSPVTTTGPSRRGAPPPAPRADVAPEPSRAPVWERHFLATAVVLGFGMFLSLLNSAIVGVDYTLIARDLGASQVDIQWVTIGYRTGQAAAIPMVAWLCTRLGYRRVFLLSMLLFAVTGTLCAMAGTLPQLVAFRVLQSLPSVIPPVVCLLLFNRVMPKPKLPLALTVYVMAVVSAGGFAPLLGGFLGEHFEWRVVFLVEVPLSLIAVAVALWLLPELPGRRDLRFDWAGALAGGVGLAALVVVANKGQDWGWSSHAVLALGAVGLDALLLFTYVELRVSQPLLDLRVLLDRTFVISLVGIGLMFTGVFLVLADVPAFLLASQQLTLTNAGLVLVPQALAWLLSVPAAGWLNRKIDGRLQAVAGLVLLGGGTMALTRINVDIPRSFLGPLLCVRAVGLGLVLIPVLGGGVAWIAPSMAADAMTIRLIFQYVVSGMGVGAFTAVAASRRAQVFRDRSALLTPQDVASDPRLSALQARGPSGLTQLFQQLQNQSLGQSYSDIFLISGLLTLAAIVLVPFMRAAPRPAPESPSARGDTSAQTSTGRP